jgi:hypothetical protein
MDEKTKCLMLWLGARRALADAKTLELDLRNALVRACGVSPEVPGTERCVDLPTGRSFAISVPEITKVDAAVDSCTFRAACAAAAIDGAKIFRAAWTLDKAGYRELTEAQRALVSQVLTIKPGQATIKINGDVDD